MNTLFSSRIIIALLIGLLVGGFFSWMIFGGSRPTDPITVSEVRESGYIYISPLLACDTTEPVETALHRSMHTAVEKIISSATEKNTTSHVSAYFRDLNNGPWFGINEKETFTPASLLKVPVMIAALKRAEQEPGYLDSTIIFDPEQAGVPQGNGNAMAPGQGYSVQELLERMVAESDNNAFHLLTLSVGTPRIKQVHADLGIAYPQADTPENFITVKEYASLFRVLYNSSYLTRDMSELALQILTEATFDRGLTAGLPDDIMIANKFGIRGTANNDDEQQLHDCGIIYYPDYPYLLCVMSRGTDHATLSEIIQSISKTVYDHIVNE